MHAIHRILVAIRDPAEKTQPALTKAALLATRLEADVQLFHGITDRLFTDPAITEGLDIEQLEQERQAEFRRQLEVLARPLRRRGLKVSTAVEWDFPSHEAIVRNAMRFGADLIVVAGHAGHHHLPWLLRYTDWELLRCSPVPVLLVKSPNAWRHPTVLAALDPGHAFAKPSGLDDEILRCGATVAEALKGKIHAVHAYSPVPMNLAVNQLAEPGAVERAMAKAETAAMQALKAVTDPFSVPRAHLHVAGRHPADAIHDVSRETGAQIIALGSISRSGLDRVVIGNTAESLIDTLACDILVVKPPYFHHGVARTPRGARVVALAAAPGGF